MQRVLQTLRGGVLTPLPGLIIGAVVATLPGTRPAWATTDLADRPLTLPVPARPNLMVTLDNSGSMDVDYLPDSANSTALKCHQYPGFNRQYYDPTQTYVPGMRADGTPYPNAAFTAALTDPYASSSSTVDLSRPRTVRSRSTDVMYYVDANRRVAPLSSCNDLTSLTAVMPSTLSTAEKTNFANWYSYHRTRLLSVKTSISRAFSALDQKYRVGLWLINQSNGSLNGNGYGFVPINDFVMCGPNIDCSHRVAWYRALFATVATGLTPLPPVMVSVGEYFATGNVPGLGARGQPVINSCQRNLAIIATDGTWNTAVNSSAQGNFDNTVPSWPAGAPSPLFDPVAGQALVPGTAFPAPYHEGRTPTSWTLADIAMKYWSTDLHAGLPNVLAPTPTDPATWQHLNTYAIGLGIGGSLNFDAATLNRIKDGQLSWPVPRPDEPSAVDDLWHATVNGHGEYFSVRSGAEFGAALERIISATSRVNSNAALTVNSQRVAAGLNTYMATFDPAQWTGDLQAYVVDAAADNTTAPVLLWSAARQLETRSAATRKIASWSGTQGVTFTAAGARSLGASQLARLNSPGAAVPDHERVIAYLRGHRADEFNALSGSGIFRRRERLLGDIVDAAPLYVGLPERRYADAGHAAFRAQLTTAGRTAVVYAAANDGMLHAFRASDGEELWAYVPGLLIDMPYVLSNPPVNAPATSALLNLTARHNFVHLAYANGSPVAADVDLSNTRDAAGTTEPAWKTILVAGLNKGGRGYYALDITHPNPVSEAALATQVLWEFPGAATDAAVRRNIGYSYGKPVVVKTRTAGWVVLVTSGYNNNVNGGDGKGRLFVLNARTGALIRELVTPAGSVAAPAGLAQISAWVEQAQSDNVTGTVYGGDLLGNLWRFDLDGPPDSWRVGKLITFADAAGNVQPVTTAPELSKVGNRRLVVVGTGRLLGEVDLPRGGQAGLAQSIYGVLDDPVAAPLVAVRSELRATILRIVDGVLQVDAATGTGGNRGWLIDLPRAGERSVSDGALARGIYTQVTMVPQALESCVGGATSFIYDIDVGSGAVQASVELGQVFVGGSTLLSKGTQIEQQYSESPANGNARVGRRLVAPPASSAAVKRVLWREILE